MPIEIQVGPPSITISRGRTFMVTDQRGEINPQTDAGVYAIDTRFVSSYRLFINREPLVLVNSSQLSFYAARWYLTNPKISTESGDVEANTLDLTIERTVEEGIHEDFDLANYTGKPLLASGRPLALGSVGENGRSGGSTAGPDPGHRRT